MNQNCLLSVSSDIARKGTGLLIPQKQDAMLGGRFLWTVYSEDKESLFPGGEIHSFFSGVRQNLHNGYANEVLNQDSVSEMELLDFAQQQLNNYLRIELDCSDGYRLIREKSGNSRMILRRCLQASHRLPKVPEGHKCGHLHGHNYWIWMDVSVSDSNDALHAERVFDAKIHSLSHRCMNEVKGLENTTAEILSQWLYDEISKEVPKLSQMIVFETPSSGAIYDGSGVWHCFKSMDYDSAVPASSGMLSGHTYRIILGLSGKLDPQFGWVMDFGDLKQEFTPVYDMLDHQRMDDIQGNNLSSIDDAAKWVFAKLEQRIPLLTRVTICDTRWSGFTYESSEQFPYSFRELP